LKQKVHLPSILNQDFLNIIIRILIIHAVFVLGS